MKVPGLARLRNILRRSTDSEELATEHPPWAIRNAKWIVLVGGAITVSVATMAVWLWPTGIWVTWDLRDALIDQSAARAARTDAGLKLATGLGAAVAGLLTWGRLELTAREHRRQERDLASRERAANNDFTLRDRSQRSERFGSAVQLLGHDQESVRLGALYALQGLAKDSPEDAQTIYDVVCSYVRSSSTQGNENSQWAPPGSNHYESALSIALACPAEWRIRLDLRGTIRHGRTIQTSYSNCDFPVLTSQTADSQVA